MTTLENKSSGHSERVHALATQLKARPSGSKVTIRKTTPSHSVRDSAYKSTCHPVDVSKLTEILAIDPVARLATVEGQVLIGDLAKATLAHGLLPAVVPEFRKFTVAGLVNGEGIQSSSHRYGLFTNTLESVDLLIADGSVMTTSSSENAGVFKALPESLGTLGIVTAATIRLAPAKPWVKLSYRRFETHLWTALAFQSFRLSPAGRSLFFKADLPPAGHGGVVPDVELLRERGYWVKNAREDWAIHELLGISAIYAGRN